MPRGSPLGGNDTLLAKLSHLAYRPDHTRSSGAPAGWKYVKELSTGDLATWIQPKTKSAVVAFRGTNIKNPTDLLADAGNITAHINLPNSRFSHCLAATELALGVLQEKHYARNSIQVTGHSLGGGMALQVGSRLHLRGVAFNPGVSSAKQDAASKVKVVQQRGDPVSGLRSKYKGKVVKLGPHLDLSKPMVAQVKDRFAAHGLSNFLSEQFLKST